MESIQQYIEKFTQEIVAVDLTEGLTAGMKAMKCSADELICRVVEEKLHELDQALFENSNLRRGWVVEQKNAGRQLLTVHGLLQFKRRYYCKPKTGARKYLVDDLVGIAPSERIEVGLAAELCEKAVDNSYAKSAWICCDGQVSRQTVMRRTRQIQNCQLPEPEPRTGVRVVHVQADEDHVAMQDGRRDTIVKLAAIHEAPLQLSKKRWQLPHRHLMSSYNESAEDFWLRVADEIDRRYGDADNLTIYIHGDGASWIRSGTKWLKNSHFVLDKFHVSQMVNRVTGNDVDYRQYIWDQFDWGERRKINNLVQACIDSGVCAASTGEEFMQYIRNNWDGIQIWYDKQHQANRSCAEGLVSHVLSSRLSSRPCGWGDEGLETISRLRVHVLNGGQIRPENVRRNWKPVIRTSQRLRQHLQFEAYNESRVLYTNHRSSSEYRLFKAITRGGVAI